MTDPIAILVNQFATVLIHHGKPPLIAYLEAEELTMNVILQLNQAGAAVGQLLQRVQVYDMRTRGIEPHVIQKRLGISRPTVWRAYKAELLRRRYVA